MNTPTPYAADSALARVRIVLVETSHPGNIGAAARAMKTMGLSALALVAPAYFPHSEAQAMASRATDILAAARVFGTLDEALAGTVFAVAFCAATTAAAFGLLAWSQVPVLKMIGATAAIGAVASLAFAALIARGRG